MANWKLIAPPRTVEVTRLLAQGHASLESVPGDRPLSERRLQVYRKILKEGSFRPVAWATALCLETGTTYRVNGKHTSTILAGCPDPFPSGFYAVYEEYECPTLADAAELYSTFDSATQSRTSRDIYLSFAGAIHDLRELPASCIVQAISGIALHDANGNMSKLAATTPAERAEALFDHVEFVQWLHTVLSNTLNPLPASHGGCGLTMGKGRSKQNKAKHLSRAPVIAAMLATWKRDPMAAGTFWCAVRDETGAHPGTPDRKIARYLMQVCLDSGSASKVKVDQRQMMVKCLHAWNAWRRGETTNLNYHADREVPAAR